MMNAYMRMHICKRYGDSSWTSWTEPHKYLTTRHLQLWNHVQWVFCGLVLLDTGMSPILLGLGTTVEGTFSSSRSRPAPQELRGSEQCSYPCDSQGMLKVRVSDLKSEDWDFLKFQKVKKNTLYVCFITRRGVARLNVDTVYIVKQRLLHFCFNFCFFFVFKPIFTEHP